MKFKPSLSWLLSRFSFILFTQVSRGFIYINRSNEFAFANRFVVSPAFASLSQTGSWYFSDNLLAEQKEQGKYVKSNYVKFQPKLNIKNTKIRDHMLGGFHTCWKLIKRNDTQRSRRKVRYQISFFSFIQYLRSNSNSLCEVLGCLQVFSTSREYLPWVSSSTSLN